MIDPNKICYLFDVDGTLTEPREKMLEEHAEFFKKWAVNKQLYISTGSDFSKIAQQIDQDCLNFFKLIFCCMGNEALRPNGLMRRRNNFIVPEELNIDLENFLSSSKFSYRTGTHFEARTGMLNFSIVGREATQEQRKEYSDWDAKENERVKIAEYINLKYPDLEASVGGSISIDIIEKGCDKGQVVTYLEGMGVKKLVFVGDRCHPGGNDYGVIRELKKSQLAFEWYNVSGPNETFKLIKENKVFLEE